MISPKHQITTAAIVVKSLTIITPTAPIITIVLKTEKEKNDERAVKKDKPICGYNTTWGNTYCTYTVRTDSTYCVVCSVRIHHHSLQYVPVVYIRWTDWAAMDGQ